MTDEEKEKMQQQEVKHTTHTEGQV